MVKVLTVNLPEVTRKVKNLGRQTTHALSNAVNETLKKTREQTFEKTLPEAFTLRRKTSKFWYEPKQRYGFNIKFANKQSVMGVLGSRADWLKEQERGGTRTAGNHRIAIPTRFHKRREEIMRKAKKPRALIRSAKQERVNRSIGKKPFVLPQGIFVRYGKRKGDIKALFIFVEQVRIDRQLHFEKRGREFALLIFPKEFDKQFRHAIATAK